MFRFFKFMARWVLRNEPGTRINAQLCYHLDETLDTWQSAHNLVQSDCFKALVFFLKNTVENEAKEVKLGEENYFWYYQGQREILRSFDRFSKLARSKVLGLSGTKEKEKQESEEFAYE